MHQKDVEAYYYLDDEYMHPDDTAFMGDNLEFDFVQSQPINKDGYVCKRCREYYPFAEANQKDGTLICYSCRHY
jgi:formylmethanofuran dehydrogenase subunit E